ncbi:hypothetical protein MCEMRE193_00091 [Candidatus Nanopelagicaceae bacterium]
MAKKKIKARVQQQQRQSNFKFIFIPVFVLLIKVIVMANTKNGGWLGADGENYLAGVDGLLKDGLFSKESKLLFWPAGYPIILAIFAKISIANLLWITSIVQSLFYAYASYYFVEQIRKTKLAPLAFLTALLLGFNPTLSLSSLAVGYESPIAAALLLVCALLIQKKNTVIHSLLIGVLLGFASFMQPRYLLVGLVLILLRVLFSDVKKAALVGAAISVAVMLISPASLIYRNNVANDVNSISTNLGTTMRIGAGDGVTGGYDDKNKSVPCEPKTPGAIVTDNDLVKCVLAWYVSNPVKTIKLAYNKSVFFWSPWSGPLANGTMARNPWLKIDPVVDIQKSQSGYNLVVGPFGKLVSWLWLLVGLGLFASGTWWLHKIGGYARILAWFAATPVLLSWLTSLGTIGDHRFRIPTMGLSLFLQVAGVFALRKRLKTSGFEPTFEDQPRAR